MTDENAGERDASDGPFTNPDPADHDDDHPFERTDDEDAVDPLAGRDAGDERGRDGEHDADGEHDRDDGIDPFAGLDVPPDPDADPGSADDPFERMAVDEVDIDDVWDALDDDADPPPAGSGEPGADTRSDDVVDKRVYCQRCPHFAEPPETACTLEGTEIAEVIGFGEFRVRGCPMVGEGGPGFDRRR